VTSYITPRLSGALRIGGKSKGKDHVWGGLRRQSLDNSELSWTKNFWRIQIKEGGDYQRSFTAAAGGGAAFTEQWQEESRRKKGCFQSTQITARQLGGKHYNVPNQSAKGGGESYSREEEVCNKTGEWNGRILGQSASSGAPDARGEFCEGNYRKKDEKRREQWLAEN